MLRAFVTEVANSKNFLEGTLGWRPKHTDAAQRHMSAALLMTAELETRSLTVRSDMSVQHQHSHNLKSERRLKVNELAAQHFGGRISLQEQVEGLGLDLKVSLLHLVFLGSMCELLGRISI